MNAFRLTGLRLGLLPPGPRAAITDVPGLRVGHCTLSEGEGPEAIRTGVTAILPPGDPYAEPLSAGVFVLHGHGKALGLWQVRDLGELETPILLTNTLAVYRCAEALLSWTLRRHPQARSINPVVLECNDGRLSAIERRPVREEHGLFALESAAEEFSEGCVGAGTGVVAFGYKSGIGTASRLAGPYTVGVLALPNMGRPEDFRFPETALRPDPLPAGERKGHPSCWAKEHGSLVVILATDAPLFPEQLGRLARRAALGAARTGAPASTGSGDFFLAFSVSLRFPRETARIETGRLLDRNPLISDLYRAAAEATEEAIYSALLSATPVVGRDGESPPVLRLRSR